MLKDFIKDNYGSRKGLVYYHCDALVSSLGFYRHNLPSADKIHRVVFVCQGNICRSALAEAVFKQNSNVEAASLGLDTTTGKPANERLMEILKKNKDIAIDLSDHRTTSLCDFQERPTDLLVCMELGHIRQLQKLGYHQPCVLLGAFGEKKMSRINDPYSANDQFMEKTIDKIIYHATYLAQSLKG